LKTKKKDAFPEYYEVNKKATQKIKDYFKNMIECIMLEQCCDRERTPYSNFNKNKKDSNLKVMHVSK